MAEIKQKLIVKILPLNHKFKPKRTLMHPTEITIMTALCINPLDFDNNIIVTNAIITSQNAVR